MYWRDRLASLKKSGKDYKSLLISILSKEVTSESSSISEFFKFLSGAVQAYPDVHEIVIERILQEWNIIRDGIHCGVLFKSTVSFLGRLKGTVRRTKEIKKLWSLIFSYPGEDHLKLILVREYRKEIPFLWLFEFVMRNDTELFYSVDLNAEELGRDALAVIDILLELMGKTKKSGNNEIVDELRISGLLEKIGSLWRMPCRSFSNERILKLLTLASSIASTSNNIFDSLPGLLDALILTETTNLWTFRLVDSILRKFPKRQYVLSQSRAELSQVSGQVIKLCALSLNYALKDPEHGRTVAGLVKSVLERWDNLTADCPNEIEEEFLEKVSWFLDESYKQLELIDVGFLVTNVMIFEFIPDFQPLLDRFFRNSVKYALLKRETDSLLLIVNHLVIDGGTDRSFPILFKEFPSLISDVYSLIEGIDTESLDFRWLLVLAASPRTRQVLMDFLIDPEQIHRIQNDTFWIEFMGRLVVSASCTDKYNCKSGWNWIGEELNKEFLKRASLQKTCNFSSYFYNLLKYSILNDPFKCKETIKFILKCSKGNSELFNLALERNFDILEYLKDLVPFNNEENSKKVFILLKDRIRSPLLLLDCLFKGQEDSLYEWKLLQESDNLSYTQFNGEGERLLIDFGDYLENLFTEISSDSNLIEVSEDPIQMYLEYFKYGQIFSMLSMHETLLSRYKLTELLVRIPLKLLLATGKEFGSIVLDNLFLTGWTAEDLLIISKYQISRDLLNYYKNRIT